MKEQFSVIRCFHLNNLFRDKHMDIWVHLGEKWPHHMPFISLKIIQKTSIDFIDFIVNRIASVSLKK